MAPKKTDTNTEELKKAILEQEEQRAYHSERF